jgi:hypothetical protein
MFKALAGLDFEAIAKTGEKVAADAESLKITSEEMAADIKELKVAVQNLTMVLSWIQERLI